MLVLALLQINTSWHTLRHELISTLMPIFLGNHPNSAIILHYAWHGQGQSPSIRQLIMHAMAEWYMRGEQYDQAKLSRILDVAQDLKALSMLLNGTPFAFVIDLAALASRREYLKLDKWLTDKIREHGEPFIQACMTFLKRRCPSILGGLAPEKDQPKSAQLPAETLATMLACLQACAGSVSQELSETILTMVANCSNVMNKARQPPPGVMPKGRPPSASSLDAISPVQIDPLAGMASLSIGGSAAPHTQSMQGFPPNLGSAFSTPQSPAKAFPPLSTPNQTTAFSGIGGLSSQLPVGGLGTGSLTGIGTGALGLPAVNNDPFVQRKLGTSGLKLSKVQEVIFGLALLNSSSPDLRGFAAQFIKQKLPDLLRSYIDADVSGNQEGGFQDIAIEVLHLLLSHLLFGQKGAFGVGQEQIDAFLKTLRRDFPQERCPVVLAPLLYPEKRDILMDRILPDSGGVAKTMMESSLADFMQEVGYGFCASIEECRNIIMQFGVRKLFIGGLSFETTDESLRSTITHSAHMDISQNLAVDLDTEGRYLFLNAIANQLRYPNSHTHYFSCTMLYLFAEANTEAIQEQITRVLLERLIVNRPHPWGLLITFIELIKNPAFKFWNHEFVHCAPEIEKLFQSVAQCCMGQKQAQQVMEGTGAS